MDHPEPDPQCELCEAAPLTHWYSADDVCWVADCEVCDVPMVVWRHHGTEPSDTDIAHMLAALEAAARGRFGDDVRIDRNMRQIPEHFHAHARDSDWWNRRWTSRPSRHTGIGGTRRVIGDEAAGDGSDDEVGGAD